MPIPSFWRRQLTSPADEKPADFGRYALTSWQQRLLARSQATSPGWLGRRLSLLLRRMVLKGRSLPIDASAEGFRMRVHVTDNVSERKFLFMPQFCDVAEREHLARNLSPNGVFLDIGANAGIYTLSAARAYAELGGPGKVLAVEANPVMQARLLQNVALNDFQERVRLAPVALSDRAGEVEFSISNSNLGESGLIATGGNSIRVPCLTLHSLLQQEGISSGVDGMKIDVEGMEDVILMPFFRQAPRALFPGFIIIENSVNRWQSDLFGLLEDVGYRRVSQRKMNVILALGHDVIPSVNESLGNIQSTD
jgi:FkbM family methyltransferase